MMQEQNAERRFQVSSFKFQRPEDLRWLFAAEEP